MPVWEKQEREFISDMEIREGFLISLKIQDHEFLDFENPFGCQVLHILYLCVFL